MKKALAFILALVLVPAAVRAAGQAPRTDTAEEIARLTPVDGHIYISEDPAYEKIVRTLLYTTQKGGFRGSVIVATDDRIVFASGTRLTDVDGREVTPFTTYEIGSLTKSFTALCVMKLIEEGRLSESDTAVSFFPEYADRPGFSRFSGVTVGSLLRMRSGIPDYLNAPDLFLGAEKVRELGGENLRAALYEEAFVNGVLETVRDDAVFLEYMFSCEPTREPDAAYEYSNTNYRLLAMIAERVSGTSYEAYMKETVFGPCGMTDSSAMSPGVASASLNGRGWRFVNAGAKGAGDIFSSASDLLKYDRALFGGYLLKEETLRELLTPADSYACGWAVEGDAVYHTGGTPGFSSLDYVIERNGKRLYIIALADLNENLSRTVCRYLDKYFDP